VIFPNVVPTCITVGKKSYNVSRRKAHIETQEQRRNIGAEQNNKGRAKQHRRKFSDRHSSTASIFANDSLISSLGFIFRPYFTVIRRPFLEPNVPVVSTKIKWDTKDSPSFFPTEPFYLEVT
jgi:hypothetical protein